ncbi:MAG: hypothetical protein IIV40_02435, partial [Oscillospiraceae bacterium]|nr:hypothetical protein [Oscillospiraceae bacterium]
MFKIGEHSGNGGFINLAVFNSENVGKAIIKVFRKEEGGSFNGHHFGVLPFSAFAEFSGIVFVNVPENAFIQDGSGLSRKNYVSAEFFCRFLEGMMSS